MEIDHLFVQRPKDGANRLDPDVLSIKQSKARESRGAPPMIIALDERAMADYNNFMGDIVARKAFFLDSNNFMVDSRSLLPNSQ